MAGESSGNNGYLALRRETTEGVPAGVPNVFTVLYAESFSTQNNPSTLNAAFGSKWARFLVIPGIRSHGGEFTVMAEPNTTALLHDVTLTRGTVSGSGPYT